MKPEPRWLKLTKVLSREVIGESSRGKKKTGCACFILQLKTAKTRTLSRLLLPTGMLVTALLPTTAGHAVEDPVVPNDLRRKCEQTQCIVSFLLRACSESS